MLKAHQTTRFPLEGSHLALDCASCHTPTGQGGQQFVARSTECVSCHEQNFVAAKNPDHIASGIPRDCINCHTPTAWDHGRFNHDVSRFPLTGAHRATPCLDCHVGSKFAGTPNQCVACHQANYDLTTTPKHSTNGFGTDCKTCHATSSWTAAFDHSKSQFPLTGAHRAATCNDCHKDGVYAGKPTACASCHQPDYDLVITPKHTLPSFPATCMQCHTTTVWIPSSFSHRSTAFQLTGVHITTPCAKCHVNGVYRGTTTTCESCHLPDFTTATNPNHTQYGWPRTCTTCHSGSSNTQAWNAGVTLPPQYHTMFSASHQGARGVCSTCHVTAVLSQSTCSTHHHPPSCTFLNQGSCSN